MSRRIPDIRFYDFNFNLLHTENEFLNTNWTIYYNDIGTFEAHFDLKSDTLPVVMDNDYLIAVQGKLSAIIIGKQVAGELIIYGRTCNWLLTKRITDAFENTTCTVDTLLNAKIKEAFFDSPLVAEDTIPNLPPVTIGRDDKCEIFSLVRDGLQLANLGHKLEFDPNKSQWVFRILKGNENNPLVISTANRNAYDISIKSDALKVCTQGWYKNQQNTPGEADVIWDMVSTPIPEINILRWESLLSATCESEALSELYNMKSTNIIQGKTIGVYFRSDEESLSDKCDYALGDIVSLEWQSGNYKMRFRKRVTGVNLWYETESFGEEPILEDIK